MAILSRILFLLIFFPILCFSQDRHYDRALKAYEKEQFDDALTHIEKSLKANPSSLESRLLKSDVLYELKAYEKVVGVLKGMDGLDMSHNIILSVSLYETHQFEEAGKIFRALLPEEDTAVVYSNMAAVFFNLEIADSALYYAHKAVDLEPLDSLYHTNLGLAYSENQEADRACGQFFIGWKLKSSEAFEYYKEENCDSWKNQWLDKVKGTDVNEIVNNIFPYITDTVIEINHHYLLSEAEAEIPVKLIGLRKLDVGTVFKFMDNQKNIIAKWSEKGSDDWTLKAANN